MNWILTAGVTAVVSAGVNGLAWLLFRRVIERQDARMTRQEVELQRLRDERVMRIEQILSGSDREAREGRSKIYAEMRQRYVGADVCSTFRAGLEQRLNEGNARFDELGKELRAVGSETASTGAIVKLMADQMGVRWK